MGDRVKAGQILGEMDPVDLDDRVRSQVSALKRAEMVKIPVTRKSLAEQYETMDPWNAARVACVEYGIGMPRVTWSTGFQQVRNALSQSVLFGDVDISIEDALQQAQKDIEFRMEQ